MQAYSYLMTLAQAIDKNAEPVFDDSFIDLLKSIDHLEFLELFTIQKFRENSVMIFKRDYRANPFKMRNKLEILFMHNNPDLGVFLMKEFNRRMFNEEYEIDKYLQHINTCLDSNNEALFYFTDVNKLLEKTDQILKQLIYQRDFHFVSNKILIEGVTFNFLSRDKYNEFAEKITLEEAKKNLILNFPQYSDPWNSIEHLRHKRLPYASANAFRKMHYAINSGFQLKRFNRCKKGKKTNIIELPLGLKINFFEW